MGDDKTRFERRHIEPGWMEIKLTVPAAIQLPDEVVEGRAARLKAIKFYMATCSGVFYEAGLRELSGVIEAAGRLILAGEEEEIDDETAN